MQVDTMTHLPSLTLPFWECTSYSCDLNYCLFSNPLWTLHSDASCHSQLPSCQYFLPYCAILQLFMLTPESVHKLPYNEFQLCVNLIRIKINWWRDNKEHGAKGPNNIEITGVCHCAQVLDILKRQKSFAKYIYICI